MKKTLLLMVSAFMLIHLSYAQKIKVTDGNLKFLKDVGELNITFDFPDHIKIGKMTKDVYVEKHVTDANKKEAGTGDKWKEKFFNDRTEKYEPMFMELFDDYSGDLYVAQDNSDLEYTMNVKTTFIEPGFNIGIQSKKAAVDMEITIFKTKEPDHILATINMAKAPGTAHYDQGMRIGESYAKGAKELAKYLTKKGLKK